MREQIKQDIDLIEILFYLKKNHNAMLSFSGLSLPIYLSVASERRGRKSILKRPSVSHKTTTGDATA